jgi:hypothetical protein
MIIHSAGFGETGEKGRRMEKALMETSRHYGIHVLGPNCLGLMRPEIGLNATFLDAPAPKGRLALVSQSGALCTAIIDWSRPHKMGFSTIVSLGNASDVDFGDILDYLAVDSETDAILLYVEGIHDSRRFMSGLRVAANSKPVIVLKVGRHQRGVEAATTHTGAMFGSDEVFEAALERAGVDRPFILAGGLTPENVAQAITTVGPWGVDVASGVEASPGRKDPARLRQFMAEVRRVAPRQGDEAERGLFAGLGLPVVDRARSSSDPDASDDLRSPDEIDDEEPFNWEEDASWQ